ncbi:hypothetical protein J2Z60_001128 [Lactobacillus colini]|uniref:Initiator Rep protein WH1 domain-containing protein n=1 Tax=Lactobacillus colini TaxID=1819254 RepID=A0ABS4ME36_9LACO|nr:replication initiation protein [Lactobacillus colini]MBP2057953.1 hypothetical protein [Lactobacillus colini]
MANEIVKYQNRLNDIPLRKFNAAEMNILFAIFSRVRDKDQNEVVLSFDYLKQISNYSKHENFALYLQAVSDKLLGLNAYTDDGNTYTKFVLFNEYTIIRDEQLLKVAVNPKFKGLFNDLKNWTRFSLQQFTHLDSTYSKTIFRLVKQFRTVGKRTISLEDFRTKLDIPKSYRTSHIDKRIISVAKQELAPLLSKFNISKNYVKARRGKKLKGYTITWIPEAHSADDFEPGHLIKTSLGLERINSNPYLTTEERNLAIDRFEGLQLGTTQAKWEQEHPDVVQEINNFSFETDKIQQDDDKMTLDQRREFLKFQSDTLKYINNREKLKELQDYYQQLVSIKKATVVEQAIAKYLNRALKRLQK